MIVNQCNVRISKKCKAQPSRRFNEMCKHKVRYDTVGAALEKIKEMSLEFHRVAIYKCSFCGSYHFGHDCTSRHARLSFNGTCLECGKQIKRNG